MNARQAYEQIVAHFSQPDAQLATRIYDNGDKVCEYRLYQQADSPVRCAVGCLIPDELYDPSLDQHDGLTVTRLFYGLSSGDSIGQQIAHYFLSGESAICENLLVSFLADAQRAHDNASDVDSFLRNLAVIAKNHGLTPVR